MEFYNFFRDALVWTVTLALLWPLNIPLLALAFRVQSGTREIDMEPGEFWYRSTVAALVVALATVGLVILDYGLVAGAELPAGPVHLFLFMLYILAVTWILFFFFGMDDPGQGLGLFVMYIYLPVFVLFVANWFYPFMEPVLGFVQEWLLPPT